MKKETIAIRLNCTPEIYRIIMRRQAKEKEKRLGTFSLEAAALNIIKESESKIVNVNMPYNNVIIEGSPSFKLKRKEELAELETWNAQNPNQIKIPE